MPANAVRQPLSVETVPRRLLEERVGIRFPRLLHVLTRIWQQRLPPRSRLRQALMLRTVRLGVAAANRRDYAVAFSLHDPAVELILPPELAGLGYDPVIRGREERIRFEQRWRAEWGDFRYAPEELADLGDRVLVVGQMRGSGPSSGAAFDNEWSILLAVSAGRVVREQVFLDQAEGYAAAGINPGPR